MFVLVGGFFGFVRNKSLTQTRQCERVSAWQARERARRKGDTMLINTQGYDYTDPQTGETRHVDTTVDTSDLRWGKYNCQMAVYLDCSDGGYEDFTGDGDIGESCGRVGKWLVSYDDQGFVEAYKYESVAAAITEFERIDAAFAALGDYED